MSHNILVKGVFKAARECGSSVGFSFGTVWAKAKKLPILLSSGVDRALAQEAGEAEIIPACLFPHAVPLPSCLTVLEQESMGMQSITGGRGGTLMLEGPCCCSLSCTSACGMQHLPTHNPFSSSSFPPSLHYFIHNPAHSPNVSVA